MVAASFTLRRYTPADEAAAIELWRHTWQIAYPHINFDDRVDWWRQRWRDELVPTSTITVAEANGKMLGFVTVDPCTFDIDQTVVAPEAWGLGVASAIIHEAKRISPPRPLLNMKKEQARLSCFYQTTGFGRWGETFHWAWGAPVHKMGRGPWAAGGVSYFFLGFWAPERGPPPPPQQTDVRRGTA